MSLEDITLTTNKTETKVSNNRRTIRTGESGLSIKVTVIDADDHPYDLSNIDIEFNEQKDGQKVILDDGSGNKSGKFSIADAKGGVFEYTLAPDVYSASGVCWFVLKEGNTIIDTTKDFYFDVLRDASIHIDNDNYVSSLNAQIDYFKATTQRANEEWSSLKSTINTGYQGYVSDFDKLKSDWQSQTAKINTDAQAQIDQIKADAKTQSDTIAKNASDQSTSIQTKADAQLKSQADTFSSTLADQVKQIETKRDKAISDATAQFTADVDSWTNQFNTWLTKTKSDYNSDIADLQSKLKTVQDGIDDVDTKRFPDMQAKVKQVQDAVDKAQANFDIIDFSSYAKKADIYTKQQIDSMVAAAGKVKTVNGIQPDTAGNIAIPAPDLSSYAKTADVNSRFNSFKSLPKQSFPANVTDMHNLKTPGLYNLSSLTDAQFNALKNVPSLADKYSIVKVENYGYTNGYQIWHMTNNTSCFIATWSDTNGWHGWIRNADESDISALQSSLDTKASQTDMTNVQNQLSALSSTANDNSTRLTKLENKGNGFIPITQADYDALTDDQKANGMYAIGDSN